MSDPFNKPVIETPLLNPGMDGALDALGVRGAEFGETTARKWTWAERVAALTQDEICLYWAAIVDAPDDMTIEKFRAVYPLPISELGVRWDVNQPCKECGATKGTFPERGFRRCNACGYPGQ